MANEQLYTKIVQIIIIIIIVVEHLTLPNSHLQYTTVTIVAQTNKQTNKQTNATRQNYSNANLLSLLGHFDLG